jgi:hypothetical protein
MSMLILYQPELVRLEDGNVKLSASFQADNLKMDMWYSTSPEFAAYFCHERADAFIIPLLFYAMKRNLRMKVEVPVSERLYYAISNYLQRVMVSIFPDWHEVPVDCPISSDRLHTVGAVGTGLSCGIDSFWTISENFAGPQPSGYRLTHCTFFNVGGHSPLWSDVKKTQALFSNRTARVKRCASELGLPVVIVDSNMEEILGRPFAPTHTFRTASAVLALQKLFRRYYFSSGHSAYDFNFSPVDSGDYDLFTLPILSTESLEFYPTGTLCSRVEKTSVVARFAISHRYLNVCMFEGANCSTCEKCLRTLLTLDILGVIQLYEEVFDLRLYTENRTWFIGLVLSQKKTNPCYREIYETMITRRHVLGWTVPYRFVWYEHRLKNRLKRLFERQRSSV